MAQKKSKAKQKTADKDVKKEPTPPVPAPALVSPTEPELEEQPIPVPQPLPIPVPPPEEQPIPVPQPLPIPVPPPEERPIPVPEPLPLPVPPPNTKQLPENAKSSTSYEDADHPDEQVVEGDGWGSGGGGGWDNGGIGTSEWGNEKEWGEDRADYTSEGRDDVWEEHGNHGNSGWEQTDTTPAHGIDQEQPSLEQQDHVPTQATSTPEPVPAPPPSPPPVPPPVVPTQPAQPVPHDQPESSVPQQTKIAPPQGQGQNPSHLEPKTYTFASAMANRNRPASQPATSVPTSSRPSFYWIPNQPPPPQQSMSTTKGQHNPPLTNLTPWGQPKNVDPWGDPKHQPAPPASAPAPIQKRPAWYDWGRQPQTAARVPPPANHRTDYDYDSDSDDDEYTDDDDETYDAWGRPTNASYGWGSDPRKHDKVNYTSPRSGNGMSAGSRPVLFQAQHAQFVNAMLNDVHQDNMGYQQQPQSHHPHPSHHNPEPSHHQLEKARRLKQIAEEQRRLAMEMEMRQQKKAHKQQHHDQTRGKSSKKQKHQSDGWNNDNWNNTKDEWGASNGWDNNGGQDQENDGWSQKGNNEWDRSGNDWDQGGNDWEKGGGDNSRGNGGDDWGNSGGGNGRDSGRDARGKSGGDAWGNSGGDGWNNNGGDGWNNNGGDGWNNGGGDGRNNGGGDGWNGGGGDDRNNGGGNDWNNGGGDGWNSGSGDGWNKSGGDWGNSGGDDWGQNGGGGRSKGDRKKDKSQGDAWDDHDNSWSNTKGSNGWGQNDGWDKNDGWGNGNDEQTWDEAEEDLGEESRYHVVTDPAQHKSSKTLMHATNAKDPQTTKPSTSSKLGLPPGTVNESDNQAFKPAMKAIFGNERLARDRIHWMYSPENEQQVTSVLFWIQQMESFLAFLGLLKFLETKERGALFVNVTFRLKEYPDKPAFDWLGYDQIQASTDRILQHSILATDPAQQTIVFVYLLSRTGNSVAMWRRKLQIPKDVRQKYLPAIKKVRTGLRPDKDYRIYVDELPPSDKRKQTKTAKLSKLKQATKTEPAKSKDHNPTKPAKPALKTHQRGQSLPTMPEKKRKWWQILRFAD